MLIENQNRTFKVIYWSLIFLFLGFLASPTVVSLYHILILIPAIYILKSGERFKISKSGWCLIGLGLWGIIANSVNIEELQKVRKSYDDLKFYFFGVLLILPLRSFFLRATSFQIKKLTTLLSFIIIAAFIVGISKAFFQFDLLRMEFGEFKTRSDGFTNYMRYGYASAFLFILGCGAHLNFEKLSKYFNTKLFYSALLCCFFAVFAAKTRGALLALLVGLPFLYLKYRPRIAKTIVGIGVLFVLVVGVISALGLKSKSRFLNINDGSNKKRMSQFYSAIKSIKERPVFGVGAAQFAYHVPRLKEKYDIWSKEYSGHSHNIFLEHAANLGIPGLLLFLGFLVFWAKELFVSSDYGSWIYLSYLLAFVVSGQVENLFDNTNSHLLFFIYSFSQMQRGDMKLNS